MSRQPGQDYQARIAVALGATRQQDALQRFGDAYLEARQQILSELDFEQLRDDIAQLKNEVGNHRQRYLEQFVRQAEGAGAQVHYAADAAAANDTIVALARRRGVRLAVKSKSMASEEVGLNQALHSAGVETLETDLGEWILQLAGQRPSHMVMPAIHMFRDEVAALFGQVTGQAEPAEIDHLVSVARRQLRDKFIQADMGISGANLAVAETGALALVTNEGNARLIATLPPVHVILVGIDKLVPTLEDAARVLQLLPRSATAQAMTSYVSWIRGPVPREGEAKELHIVLLDNGRSTLAADPECKDALRCLKCGACANVCPVYQTIGGHVFGHTYVGAIGLVLTAFFNDLQAAAPLIKACIGCRACAAVCPAQIDLEEIILKLRRRIGDQQGLGIAKSLVFRRVLRNRRLFHALLRSAFLLQKPVAGGRDSIRHLPLHFSALTEWRTLPLIAAKPLRDLLPAMEGQPVTPRLRVTLFAGCATDFVHPQIGLSLVSLLNRSHIAVDFPQDQTCCGIPALYSGDRQTAVELARQNVRALMADDPAAVVTTCPTCSAALRQHFVELLQDDAEYAEAARRLAAITQDAAVFMAAQGPELPSHSQRGTLTYHDSCHLKRGCGVWQEPRQLLSGAGWQVQEMERSDRCCGFGGSYSFASHPEISREITKDKVNAILRSGAEVVAVDCPGCLIMLRGALEKRGLSHRVVHTMELLGNALEALDKDSE